MKRFVRVVLASLAAVLCLAATATARAQEIELTGPLKGAPAVRHQRLYRQGRFEIAPTLSFTLLDQYRRTLLVGALLNYSITDWLGIGVWGGYGVLSSTTTLTNEIDTTAPRDALTATQVNHSGTYGNYGYASFKDQTAILNWVAVPQLTFTPFRGKLAIFNKIFVDTDLSLALGIGFAGIQERGNCGGGNGQPNCSDPATATSAGGFARTSSTKVSYGSYALQLTFFPTELFSLGVEYRALPFNWNLSGFDTRGGPPSGNFPDRKITGADDTFQFNQMVTILFGFSLPAKAKISE
jgi:hypothetical protein